MTAAGYKIWWKKYLTTLQITQFVIDLFIVYFACESSPACQSCLRLALTPSCCCSLRLLRRDLLPWVADAWIVRWYRRCRHLRLRPPHVVPLPLHCVLQEDVQRSSRRWKEEGSCREQGRQVGRRQDQLIPLTLPFSLSLSPLTKRSLPQRLRSDIRLRLTNPSLSLSASIALLPLVDNPLSSLL